MTPIPPDARALTIRQPWASLIALGVKTIETRGWRTDYRGPLVIHAGLTYEPWNVDGGDDEWKSGSQVLIEPKTGNEHTWRRGNPFHRCPLGLVVAVVDLVDVVPIVDDWPLDTVAYVRREQRNVTEWWLYTDDTGRCADVTGQEPYGDFTPGRYAWLLDNVRPVDPPIPAKGRQGLWRWSS